MEAPQKNILTVDIIIAKFVPIIGALLFITWLGYLIYTSVWSSMGIEFRLGLGFFTSLLIIGVGFWLSDKLKYFADIVIGSGVLLFYWTLIYWSRTTDFSHALIPEIATLITAVIFTIAISWFASYRKSKVILILGILGAYLTPFVIGQNDVWASNISFNAYLIYFAAINAVIFVLWREISVHDIIPINLTALFFWTFWLYTLVYRWKIIENPSFFTSESMTIILLALLVIFSVFAISYSSKYFTSKQDTAIIAIGYLTPLFWFLAQLNSMGVALPGVKIFSYLAITCTYFFAWYQLRNTWEGRVKHIAAYVWGIIALIFAVSNLFGRELNPYSGIFIGYIGLGFMVYYIFSREQKQSERFITAVLLTVFGAWTAINTTYYIQSDLGTTLAQIISLIPAIALYPISRYAKDIPNSLQNIIKIISFIASIIAGVLLFGEIAGRLDTNFVFFILPGMILTWYAFIKKDSTDKNRNIANAWLILFTIGFFEHFISLIGYLAPHEADGITLFGNEWEDDRAMQSLFYGILAIGVFYVWVRVIRNNFLGKSETPNIHEKQNNNATFAGVLLFYTSILLSVNFFIILVCNTIGIPYEIGWIRAIATTIWWITLAIIMIFIGVKKWISYKNDKLLWLLLLLLTIAKIAFYDLTSMAMSKKIIVLMIVGWFIMMFSYFLQVKWYLSDEKIHDDTQK